MATFDPEIFDELVTDFRAKTDAYNTAADANNSAQVAAQAAMGDAAVAMDAQVMADKARDASADALIEYIISIRDSLRAARK